MIETSVTTHTDAQFMNIPELMTLPEAAAKARVALRTLHHLIAPGRGPITTHLGGRTVVRNDHFAEWVDGNARRSAGDVPCL